jgi:hypothetical protein
VIIRLDKLIKKLKKLYNIYLTSKLVKVINRKVSKHYIKSLE